MGHYDGYTIEDFEMLLKLLGEIKGKFLLSSYPSELLEKYTTKTKWQTISIEQKVSAGHYSSRQKKKIEVLTANYGILKHI